ncbi:hypothetical protein [Variovorax sp. RKNM96]|nr:hypothetical protein [Variovorax sp. RKNM96]
MTHEFSEQRLRNSILFQSAVDAQMTERRPTTKEQHAAFVEMKAG